LTSWGSPLFAPWGVELQHGPILLSDPRIHRIKVQETGEPFVDLLTNHVTLEVDRTRSQIGNMTPHFACVRRSVAHRLVEAQRLLPKNMMLQVKEGFRPLSLQIKFYQDYSRRVARERPTFSPQQVAEEVAAYVAPPEVAPHCTGGAVDLTLIGSDGEQIDMGSPFNYDPISTMSAAYFHATNISANARRNRDLLKECMEAAGFVNYLTEWRHWSYGDKYWAFCTGQAEAIFGACDEPFFL
jgi:D-alanyl-D-alanine dipeptidase